MLSSINDANEFIVHEVEKTEKEQVDMTERAILEDLLEESFFEKIEHIVNEEEFQKAKLKSPEELEGFLFHKVPNYLTLLEEATTEVLSDYLSE